MVRSRSHIVGLLAGVLALAALISCQVQFGTPIGGGNENASDNENSSDAVCGERTIETVPAAGLVVESFRIDSQTSPEDSALASILGLAALIVPDCPGLPGLPDIILEGLESELEVGADGAILSRDGETVDGGLRFAVVDGCLVVQSDGDVGNGNDNTGNDNEGDDDNVTTLPFQPDSTGCEEGQFALGPDGVGDTSEGYVCVSVKSDFCVDCRLIDGVWTQLLSGSSTYKALAAIAGVRTFDLCTQQTGVVDVADGDRVTIDFELEIRYEPN